MRGLKYVVYYFSLCQISRISWEMRGLKFKTDRAISLLTLCRISWEMRGLKFRSAWFGHQVVQRRISWEMRGLKSEHELNAKVTFLSHLVRDAWIEMPCWCYGCLVYIVASRERCVDWNSTCLLNPRPQLRRISWEMRGLKYWRSHRSQINFAQSHLVRDAWIEIINVSCDSSLLSSRISWEMRGLKWFRIFILLRYGSSHLVRDAWIEIWKLNDF